MFITTIVKALRERAASLEWWKAVGYFALASGGLLPPRWKYIALSRAGSCYARFYRARRVRLYERLAKFVGKHKVMVVARVPDLLREFPQSKAEVFWVRAKSVEQALHRLESTEWGGNFKVVYAQVQERIWNRPLVPDFSPATLEAVKANQSPGLGEVLAQSTEPEVVPSVLPSRSYSVVFFDFYVTYRKGDNPRTFARRLSMGVKSSEHAYSEDNPPADPPFGRIEELLSSWCADCRIQVLTCKRIAKSEPNLVYPREERVVAPPPELAKPETVVSPFRVATPDEVEAMGLTSPPKPKRVSKKRAKKPKKPVSRSGAGAAENAPE